MRRAIDTWVNRPAWDYLVCALASALGFWADLLKVSDDRNLGAWFQTLASVSGVLLGFGGVAVTVVFAVAPSDRLALVYESTGPRLSKLVISCLGALVVTTGGFTALFLMPLSQPQLLDALTLGLIAFTGLRFARLWWLFRRVLIALMTRTPRIRQQDPQPQSTWTRPVVRDGDYAVSGRRVRRRSS